MLRYLTSLALGALSLLGVVLGLLAIFLLSMPDVTRLKGCLTTEMYKVNLCPGGPGYVPLKEISPSMVAAVIISEDSAFYQHHGFDFNEIKNSLDRNLETGSFARGGSTISQQLVKNVFLTADKSLIRKLKEAFLTYELEKTFKKNEILERYLNVVEFGQNLYGVKAAALYYFKKSPSQLNVLESAFLTALLPNPKKYSASFRAKALTKYMRGRVQRISGKLRATGRITAAEYEFSRTHLDDFPWAGLGSPGASPTDFLDSLEKTDFSAEPAGIDSGTLEAEPEDSVDPDPEPSSETTPAADSQLKAEPEP